ncbi:hypothetical protein [Myxosarcina sp. GI1]|uniref:WD40/YVTN/BNR-like repeat-containing protein n=1 Tax=Myxosarcina sp. GI1 TaxID=1541065 RepID=UPI00155A7317|nr:hypothetical protein [Myxosarcina sp. GI1]
MFIGETGKIPDLNHINQTIVLENTYTNPVVFAQPLSRNGSDPAVVRIDNVKSDRFNARIQEPNYEDGFHTSESFSYLVLEKGTWELENGIQVEVGTLDSDTTTSLGWEQIGFSTDFESSPITLSQVQTNNGSDFVRTRQKNTSASGFSLAMEEEEALKTFHPTETLGWMAISPGKGSWNGLSYQAGNTGNRITHKWSTLNFSNSFDRAPQFLASLSTYDGSDSAGIRYRNLNSQAVEIMVEEDSAKDKETSHTTEEIDFLSIDGTGALTAFLKPTTSPPISEPSEEFWQPLREPGVGGWISSIGISPHDSDHLIVGGDMLGVAVSDDGGKNWIGGQGLKSWEIEEITFDPKLPNKIWLATKSGPYVSYDYGKTWTEKRNGFPDFEWGKYVAPVQQILIDRSNTDRLLAFTGNQRRLDLDDPHQGEVYESVDGGENWQKISDIGTVTTDKGNNIFDVTFAGKTSTRIFAATEQGLFRSDDSGFTWQGAIGNLPPGNQKTVATHPSNPDIVLATVEGQGIYRSTNGGKTFNLSTDGIERISNRTSFDQIRFAPSNPNIVLVGVEHPNGTFMSKDGGQTWSKVSGHQNTAYPMQTQYFRALAINPKDSSHIVGGTGVSIWESSNGGSNWQDISSTQLSDSTWKGNGYSGLVVTNIRWNPYNPEQSFIAAMDAGKWMSRNDMRSWSWAGSEQDNGMPDWSGVRDITFTDMPTNSQVIYATVVQDENSQGKGIYRSEDGGKTWQFKGFPNSIGDDADRIIAHPTQTNKVWVIWDDKLYFSNDSGATWSRKLSNAGKIYELIENNKTPEFDLYVGSELGLWSSNDLNGNNYFLVSGSNSEPRGISRMDFVDDDTFYSVNDENSNGSQRGIWMYDAGEWKQLTNNKTWDVSTTPFLWVSDIAVDPRNSQRILAATNQNPFLSVSEATGVWKSEDGGKTWQQFNDGLAMLRVDNIQFKPNSSGTVVIGTTGGGAYIGRIP